MMKASDLGISLPRTSSSEVDEILPENVVLLGYRGSIAHGMYVPPDEPTSIDDKDVLGVCFGPIDSYCGLKRFEQHEKMLGPWDAVTYEYRKFLRLLAGANPNVLSLLWLEPNHYIYVATPGQQLIDHRSLFATRRIYHAFTGYAYSQLKRMTHLAFKGYMGQKRKALVEQFGYDCKNAAHLIRLLRMGIEFLREGTLHVMRPDAPQLLEIKRGLWTLEQVKAEAEHLFKRAEAAFDACTLPIAPDMDQINALCVTAIRAYITERA